MNNLTAGTGDPYWYEWSVGLLYMVKMINSDSGIKNVVLQSEDSQSLDDVVVTYCWSAHYNMPFSEKYIVQK